MRPGSNRIDVVGAVDGAPFGAIDLSAWVDPADPDGLVDVVDGVYDPSSNRVYFVFERGDATHITPRCTSAAPLVVGFDPASSAVVTLSDGGPGGAITLSGARPIGRGAGLVLDSATHTLFLLEGGCQPFRDAGATATWTGAGIERLDLADGTSAIAFGDLAEAPTFLLRLDAHRALVRGASPGLAWRSWDLASSVLGPPLAALPPALAMDGTRLVGLSVRGAEAGTTTDLVRYDATSYAASFVATDVLTGTDLVALGVVVPDDLPPGPDAGVVDVGGEASIDADAGVDDASSDGRDADVCAPSLTACTDADGGVACFDTTSDPLHCGDCTTFCPSGTTYSASVCVGPAFCVLGITTQQTTPFQMAVYAESQSANDAPMRLVGGAQSDVTGTWTVAADPSHGELWVLAPSSASDGWSKVGTFPIHARGNVAPIRELGGPGGVINPQFGINSL